MAYRLKPGEDTSHLAAGLGESLLSAFYQKYSGDDAPAAGAYTKNRSGSRGRNSSRGGSASDSGSESGE